MLETLRERLAWRRARKLVSKRKPRQWQTSPSARRVLLVLPAEERLARPAWQFVEDLNLDPDITLPVVPTGEIAFAPMSFLGKVKSLDSDDIGRLGLPKKDFLRQVWSFNPDVALCLAKPFDLGLSLIVGASPAAFRAGFSDNGADLFFDLMVGVGGEFESSLQTLSETLTRIRPQVLAPAEVPARSTGRAAY